MSSLVIDNLRPAVLEIFRERASSHGMSESEFGLRLIEQSLGVLPEENIERNIAFTRFLLSEEGRVDDLELPERRVELHREVEF